VPCKMSNGQNGLAPSRRKKAVTSVTGFSRFSVIRRIQVDDSLIASSGCATCDCKFGRTKPKTVTFFSRASRIIEINNLQDLVTVHGVGLGASNREVAFTMGRDTANKIATARDSIVA
jgi:hypothetical protein